MNSRFEWKHPFLLLPAPPPPPPPPPSWLRLFSMNTGTLAFALLDNDRLESDLVHSKFSSENVRWPMLERWVKQSTLQGPQILEIERIFFWLFLFFATVSLVLTVVVVARQGKHCYLTDRARSSWQWFSLRCDRVGLKRERKQMRLLEDIDRRSKTPRRLRATASRPFSHISRVGYHSTDPITHYHVPLRYFAFTALVPLELNFRVSPEATLWALTSASSQLDNHTTCAAVLSHLPALLDNGACANTSQFTRFWVAV